MGNYIPTIGLEIHSELKTQTKMFCDCLNDDKELVPNVNVCPVCMGHPGALPKANRMAVEMVIQMGHALQCSISRHSKFDRKNYFYPDLPKAFQISQYDLPLCSGGFFVLPSSGKRIGITRIHLEEDTAKLTHSVSADARGLDANKGGLEEISLVNYNRSGVPLMELVTEPDFSSAEEVSEFARELQSLLRYVGVSNADMDRGQLRLEANISIAPQGSDKLGTKVEVKNLNSFKAVEGAIAYEIVRQAEILDEEGIIAQETRGWNGDKGITYSQRSKEDAHDYRYFPEPDLPPMDFSEEEIAVLAAQVNELPVARRQRFCAEYNLSDKQAFEAVSDKLWGDFFEQAVSELSALRKSGDAVLVYNYLFSDIKGILDEIGVVLEESSLTPHLLAHIVHYLQEGAITSRVAKDVLRESIMSGQTPEQIITEQNLFAVSDVGILQDTVQRVISEQEKAWVEYVGGKDETVQFLVGQVMRYTKGTADPQVVKRLFEQERG